jgi:hypothetical protein
MPEGYTPKVTFVRSDEAFEPTVKKIITATVLIDDGKGGQSCFDISEINDLVTTLATLMQSDSGPVQTIDLSKGTAV